MSEATLFTDRMDLPPGDPWEQVPEARAVFFLRAADAQAEPYLGQSANLRRRLKRLLGSATAHPVPSEDLRGTQLCIAYRLTASAFESAYWLYRAARELYPSRYRRMLRLRPPALVKLGLANDYPRCRVTRHISQGPDLYYGPFASRAAAERFASDFLDLFRIRRCAIRIQPDPSFPGCIYSEMKMCLAPCFAGCIPEEYQSEVARVKQFLSSDGQSLVAELGKQREQASAELLFEKAAEIHNKIEKVIQVLRSRGEPARDLNHLHAVLVQPSTQSDCVELFVVKAGQLISPVRFFVLPVPGRSFSLERRLREALETTLPVEATGREKEEHMALLARWYFSSFRRGEIVLFSDWSRPPYRKILHACSRMLSQTPLGTNIPSANG